MGASLISGSVYNGGGVYALPGVSFAPTLGQIRANTVTYDGSVVNFWDKGQIAANVATTTGVLTSANNTVFSLGTNPGPNGSAGVPYFNGKIYTVRIYDRALSNAEIEQNYKIDQSRFGVP
jgi:hypothetical protein